MKKIIAFLLVLAMLLTLTVGCAKKQQELTLQERLAGIWKGQLDIAGILKAQLGEALEGLELENILITVILSFTQDGTYTLDVDEETLTAAIDGLMETLSVYLRNTMEKEMAALGLGSDQILGALSTTVEGFVDKMLDSVRDMDLGGQIAKEIKAQGKVLAEVGKLYISESVDAEPDQTTYLSYTLEGDVLIITEQTGGTEFTLPMILKKSAEEAAI